MMQIRQLDPIKEESITPLQASKDEQLIGVNELYQYMGSEDPQFDFIYE